MSSLAPPGPRTALLGAAAVVLLAVALRWLVFNVTDFRGDELIYVRYAGRISSQGLAEFGVLAEEYATNPSLWASPPPSRVLYLLMTAMGCAVAGACSGTTVAGVSFVAGIALVAFTVVLAGRMFGARVALLAGLLVAVSPLQLQLSRRALQDGLFSLTVLLALWAFWERGRSPRMAWEALLGGALLAALLTKETSIIYLIALFGALVFPGWLDSGSVPFTRSIVAAILLPLPLAALILFALIPNPQVLPGVFAGLLVGTDYPYAVVYSGGRWFRYIVDFLLLSPVTALLAIGYYFRPDEEPSDRFLGRFTLVLFLVLSLLPVMNVRYISFLDVPMRILAVLTLASLVTHPAVAWMGQRVLTVAVLVLAAYDLFLFDAIFIDNQVYDPVTANLARAARLIP